MVLEDRQKLLLIEARRAECIARWVLLHLSASFIFTNVSDLGNRVIESPKRKICELPTSFVDCQHQFQSPVWIVKKIQDSLEQLPPSDPPLNELRQLIEEVANPEFNELSLISGKQVIHAALSTLNRENAGFHALLTKLSEYLGRFETQSSTFVEIQNDAFSVLENLIEIIGELLLTMPHPTASALLSALSVNLFFLGSLRFALFRTVLSPDYTKQLLVQATAFRKALDILPNALTALHLTNDGQILLIRLSEFCFRLAHCSPEVSLTDHLSVLSSSARELADPNDSDLMPAIEPSL